MASSAASALAGRPVEQVDAVEMQQVEDEHRQRLAARAAAMSTLRPNRDAVTWNRCGRPSGRSAIASASAIRSRHRQRQRRLDHLRQPFGDVVEAAGVDRHRVAGAVDLHPCAVELGLENRCAAEAFEGLADTGRGLGQHRADRPADLEGELVQRRPRRRSARRPRRRAGRRPASPRAAPPAAATSAAFATASAITPTSAPWRSSPPSRRRRNVCSVSVAAANRSVDEFGAPRLRSLPGNLADLAERGVDAAGRSATARPPADGSERSAAQPTPICRCGSSPDSQDTTTATSFGSSSVACAAQQVGDAGDLGQPRRGRADLGRRGGDVNELHEPSLARPSDISRTAR